jgi:hypothetical protein
MIDEPDGSPDEPMIRKRPGRPPGSAKAAPVPKRAYARQATRQEQPRDLAREPARDGVVVQGRDGEVLSRKNKDVGDPFYVDPRIIPKGWDYQWNTYTVHGQIAVDEQVNMHANGWRAVPASRHPGLYVPVGEQGAIIKKGLRLEERPKAMSEEARQEEYAKAYGRMRDATDSLRLTSKLPQGMEISKKYRGTGGDVRISTDRYSDIPAPSYQPPDDSTP